MIKQLLTLFLFLVTCVLYSQNSNTSRGQWSEKQAWEWQERVGVIKGFNEPYPAYPGMSRVEVLKKAHEVGLNSVRFWVRGRTAEEQIEYIRQMIHDASLFNMTVSPVLPYVCDRYWRNRGNQPMEEYEQIIRTVVRAYADEDRIVFWDLWNEPRFEDREETYEQLDIIEQMVEWCRSENLRQPITSSIIWATIKEDSKSLKRMAEVESMMDIHNFHYYNCAINFGENIYRMMDFLKKLGDRPMVATECLTRTNGSGIPSTFAAFSKYHVNFYIWGLYVNDRNWETRWGESTYDPYDPMFHNILYSDGDAYDSREIDMIRNYRFCDEGEELYPPLEYTDRWSHERAWKWMACGPLKGLVQSQTTELPRMDEAYNAVQLKLEYNEWQSDSAAFYNKMESFLSLAAERKLTVMPVLLSDDDFYASHQLLAEYVGNVLGRYYCDTRIKAWELYRHPGEKINDTEGLGKLISLIFRYARNQYTNQPLTMTPYVDVKEFEPGFDYWGALIHGRTNGWNYLRYGGGSTADLCYKIWKLSDVISFSTRQQAPEAGWLASICYRFGRPIFCTQWDAPSDADVEALLERFAISHIFWFSDQEVPSGHLKSFAFRQTSTQRQITEGIE